MVSRPHLLQNVLQDLLLNTAVERQQRPVENEEIGALQQRPGNVQLLPLRTGQPASARADVEAQADVQHIVIEPQLVEDVANDGA